LGSLQSFCVIVYNCNCIILSETIIAMNGEYEYSLNKVNKKLYSDC